MDLGDLNPSSLGNLRTRLACLENKVLGGIEDPNSVLVNCPEDKCVDNLVHVSRQIGNFAASHEKISSILRRVDEIAGYLDPVVADDKLLSLDLLWELIQSEENSIADYNNSLKKAEELSKYLDSEHIRNVSHLQTDFLKLNKKQIDQERDITDLSEKTKKLLLDYNKLVETITKKFIVWEEILTEQELARRPKKIVDE